MLYHLCIAFADDLGPLRVFRYPSFRIPAAALTALILTLWLFPRFIELLKRLQRGVSNVREDTPEEHQKKSGTPTMGGLFILGAVVTSTLLWADLENVHVWAVIGVTVGFGAIGFVDDYRKVRDKNSKGLSGRYKLFWQVAALSVVTGLLLLSQTGWLLEQWVQLSGTQIPSLALALKGLGLEAASGIDTRLAVPFVAVKWFNPDIGWLYLPFAFLVVMGTSHAVNLTDGLDGLAIGPTIVSSSTFMVLAYAAGLVLTFKWQGQWVDFNVAEYLNIAYIEGISELAILCGGIVGAGIGFLWYNTFPATVFMGDVGSLALGGALGAIAVLTKNEFLSAIVHGVFLLETLSVITQVVSFKLFGRRVFKMAPIHHHFEIKGWAEPKIIVRFWILAIMLALLAMVTLKLR